MRIYGGHDYYDCALSLGIDKSIVLVRHDNMFVCADDAQAITATYSYPSIGTNRSDYWLASEYVVFTDKLYKGVKLTDGHKHEFIWDKDKLVKRLAELKLTLNLRGGWWNRVPVDRLIGIEGLSEGGRSYMIENKFSIMVHQWNQGRIGESRFQVNPPNLKQLGFASVLDPYTAFQELSMWIGGVLGGNSPQTVTISDDKVLIASHGFDKHSFRSSKGE